MYDRLLERIVKPGDSKILLIVVDGLGGLPSPDTGKTELETAVKPEIDKLAQRSALGVTDPIAPGITPGSGPAHLAIFGYDPVKWEIGRGILSALGIGFPVERSDLTARGNFASVDAGGIVTDRRAGRISTEKSTELCGLLDGMRIGDTQVFVRPEKEHRFAVIFRGRGFSDRLTDSDPQVAGQKPRQVEAKEAAAAETARIVNTFLDQAIEALKGKSPANAILLRGFAKHPELPSFSSRYKIKACAIAAYPMYKGLARLVGMSVIDGLESLDSQVDALAKAWHDFDFFYFHYKKPDSRGEDGDFAGKVKAIEELDRYLPRVIKQSPDVLVLTGDHSTPSVLKMHSWHPVPLLVWSRWIIADGLPLNERTCARGGLGRLRAVEVLPLMMANALRLEKFGA
ncbi:MAG: 2,3-bisphosphoglycerate-independent phosphoglycerate mutase [Candidatus Eisenbacteria bacterium]